MTGPFDSGGGDVLARVERQLAAERARSEDLSAALARAQLQVTGLERRLRLMSDASDEAALRAALAALQASFDAAVAKHADEARALREEAELYRALARDRDTELSRVNEECSILRQSMESAIVELDGVRAEHGDLSGQLRRFGNGGLDVRGFENGARPLDPEIAKDGRARGDLSQLGAIEGIDGRRGRKRLVVLNVDGDAFTRGGIEEAVAATPGAIYSCDPDAEPPPGAEVCLAVNFASDDFDLGWLSDTVRWGLDEPEALAYCGREGQGVFFGKVMFFPPPCDFDECASRIFSGSDTLQRVLAVGEDVDFMSGLRESLGRVRISTAIAFDGGQTADLIPMVKPQMILVDLNLPGGDGLRIAAEIACNPDRRDVAIAMFWSQPIDPVSFRQQAFLAMNDLRIDRDVFARSVREILDDTMRGIGSLPFPGRAMARFVSNQARS